MKNWRKEPQIRENNYSLSFWVSVTALNSSKFYPFTNKFHYFIFLYRWRVFHFHYSFSLFLLFPSYCEPEHQWRLWNNVCGVECSVGGIVGHHYKENHSLSRCRDILIMVCQASVYASTVLLFHVGFRQHHRTGAIKVVGARGTG